MRNCTLIQCRILLSAKAQYAIVDCTISAQGGVCVCVYKISFFYHFLTDWFNAVSILLSVQYDQSIQYNVREEDSLFLQYSFFLLLLNHLLDKKSLLHF